MGKYDFQALKNVDLLSVIERYETLKKDGPHYRCKCPFHNEDTASLVVTPNKNIWKCFGCGKGGDACDFLVNYGYTYKEAVAILTGDDAGGLGVPFPVKKLDANTKAPKVWTQTTPRSQPTEISHYRYGIPHHFWPYHDKNGVIVSYDCRFNHEDGTKDVLPFTFCTDGKDSMWRWQGMDKPRLLSNLHLLHREPERPVLIVEGKKTAAAAERLLSKPIITTWQGGGNGVSLTDWSILKGRKITIWPDNDYPGYKAACEIASIIHEYAGLIRFIHNPEEAEKGWDAADAETNGWTPEQTREFIIKNAYDTPQKKENTKQTTVSPQSELHEKGKEGKSATVQQEQQDVPNSIPVSIPQAPLAEAIDLQAETSEQPPTTIAKSSSIPDISNHPDFKFLGFISNDGKLQHCFYSNTTRTVIKMSASNMGKAANLIELAPLDFWETYFFKKSEGFNHAAAVNFLISTSNKIGIFRHQNIRGRGAWVDGKSIVVHAGDYLIKDGQFLDLSQYRGKYIYEQGSSLGFDVRNPLKNEEAKKFLDLTKQLKWERTINGYLLAGWCVVASVCGALRWRPHIWVTGGAGSGKTWVLNNLIKPMLGDTSLCAQGSTSEAGLRQALKRDALPVVFDEAEGEDKNDQERMQRVLTLMRSASSEDGGNIIKGTSSSGADSYQIRSCFAFASIALQLSQQSDRSRITILELNTPGFSDAQKKDRKEHFDKLIFSHYSLVTPDYCKKMQARTVMLLPVILENAKTFAAAAAVVLGQQRAGDQLGALLAGAYSLMTDKLISYNHAIEWLSDKDKDWSEENALAETRDERNLFMSLMDTQVAVEGAFSTYRRTIGELIRIVMGFEADDTHVAKGSAEMSMKRFGIFVSDDKLKIIISNSTKEIKKALENTPWSRNHNNLLMRIPGADKMKSVRFGSGVSTRAVSIPMSYFVDE